MINDYVFLYGFLSGVLVSCIIYAICILHKEQHENARKKKKQEYHSALEIEARIRALERTTNDMLRRLMEEANKEDD